MKNTIVSGYADRNGSLLASVISGPGRNEIQVIPLNQSVGDLKHNIELGSDEKIQAVKWIEHVESKPKSNGSTPKKNKRKLDTDESTPISPNQDLKLDYLAILLTTNEILIYSPLTKEFTNKISNDSSLSYICDASNSNIWGLDTESLNLKQFNLFENRLQQSRSWKSDREAQFLQYLTSINKLVIASSTLYIVDPKKLDFTDDEIRITPPKTHSTQITNLVQSQESPDLLAVTRESDSIIHIMSISSTKIMGALKTASNIISIVHLPASQTTPVETIAAITESGMIELFLDPFNKKGRKQHASDVQLVTDSESIGFVNLVVKSNYLVGVWLDDYDLSFTEFELDNLESLTGEVIISINQGSESNSDSEESDSGEDDEEQNGDQDEDDDHLSDEYIREEPSEVYSLIKENLSIESKLPTLISILSQNQQLSKRTTLLLSDVEAMTLFKQISLYVSDQPQQSSHIGQWLKWVLLSKGSLIAKDTDSVGVLKLVKSTLIENIKLLPNLLSLQGRLSLLQSQLKLRNEMMNRKQEQVDGDNDEDEDKKNGFKVTEASLVLDGENDDFEEVGINMNGKYNDDEDEDEFSDNEDDIIAVEGSGDEIEEDGSEAEEE